MDAIRLVVRIDTATAILGGTGRAGYGAVALSPEVLSGLTAEQRALLAGVVAKVDSPAAFGLAAGEKAHALAWTRGGVAALDLPTADTSTGPVLAALVAALDREATLRASLVRGIEAEGEAAVVRDEYQPVGLCWHLRYGGSAAKLADRDPSHPMLAALREECARRNADDLAERADAARRAYLEADAVKLTRAVYVVDAYLREAIAPAEAFAHDPEVVAKYEAVKALADRMSEAAKAEAAAKAAKVEAATRAEKAEADRQRAEIRAWAEAHADPDLSVPARAGYDVRAAVADAITADVAARLRAIDGIYSVWTSVPGAPEWDSLDVDTVRSSPRARAVLAHAAAVKALADVARPDCIAVDVLDSVRRASWEDQDAAHKATAVVASLDGDVILRRLVLAICEDRPKA